jgi:hypothetical protein
MVTRSKKNLKIKKKEIIKISLVYVSYNIPDNILAENHPV